MVCRGGLRFQRQGTNWVEQAQLSAKRRGRRRVWSFRWAFRETVVVGAFVADWSGKTDAGQLCLSTAGNPLDQASQLTPAWAEFERFGSSVAISGDTAVVGANRANRWSRNRGRASYVYVRNGNSWTEQARLTTSDGLTSDWLRYSAPFTGEIVVGPFGPICKGSRIPAGLPFRRRGTDWVEQAKLLAGDPAVMIVLVLPWRSRMGPC